jgi:hypothetical protein
MTDSYTKPITGYIDNAPLGKPGFPGTLLTDIEVEDLLNLAPGWIERHREQLQAMGFPEPVAAAGERWDAATVWQWQRAMTQIKRTLPSRELTAWLDAIAEAERKFGGSDKTG